MSKKRRSPRNTVRTLKGIAELIRAEFGIPCDRMKIKNWQTRHKPPFPIQGENNEFEIDKCFDWVRKLQARKGVKGGGGNEQLELLERKAEESRLKSKIIDEEERQFEFDKKRGKYVDREIANRTIMETISEYHTITKRNIQSLCEPELAKKIVTAIEDDCARVAKETV